MMMGKISALVGLVLCMMVASASAQSATNITAFYVNYNPRDINWDYEKAHVMCADYDADKPLSWRSKYDWTAYGGPDPPTGQETCGKCLKVTNTAYRNTSVTVRIVDACGENTLGLDITPFKQLDIDGKGYFQGHLTVNYEFVDCDERCACVI